MADNYQKFSTFIEGVCTKFGCTAAAHPLQEGFMALCEANGITAGRYAFGMVDEEAKNLLGNQDIEGFKDYVRANSSSVLAIPPWPSSPRPKNWPRTRARSMTWSLPVSS